MRYIIYVKHLPWYQANAKCSINVSATPLQASVLKRQGGKATLLCFWFHSTGITKNTATCAGFGSTYTKIRIQYPGRQLRKKKKIYKIQSLPSSKGTNRCRGNCVYLNTTKCDSNNKCPWETRTVRKCFLEEGNLELGSERKMRCGEEKEGIHGEEGASVTCVWGRR